MLFLPPGLGKEAQNSAVLTREGGERKLCYTREGGTGRVYYPGYIPPGVQYGVYIASLTPHGRVPGSRPLCYTERLTPFPASLAELRSLIPVWEKLRSWEKLGKSSETPKGAKDC